MLARLLISPTLGSSLDCLCSGRVWVTIGLALLHCLQLQALIMKAVQSLNWRGFQGSTYISYRASWVWSKLSKLYSSLLAWIWRWTMEGEMWKGWTVCCNERDMQSLWGRFSQVPLNLCCKYIHHSIIKGCHLIIDPFSVGSSVSDWHTLHCTFCRSSVISKYCQTGLLHSLLAAILPELQAPCHVLWITVVRVPHKWEWWPVMSTRLAFKYTWI